MIEIKFLMVEINIWNNFIFPFCGWSKIYNEYKIKQQVGIVEENQ